MKESTAMKENERVICGLCEEVVSSVEDAECLEGKYETLTAARSPMIYVFCDRMDDGFFVIENSWSKLDADLRVKLMREFCRLHCKTSPVEPAAVKVSEYGKFFLP